MLTAPARTGLGPGAGPRASGPDAARCRRGGGRRAFSAVEVTALQRDGDGFTCTLGRWPQLAARTVIAACGSWNAKGPVRRAADAPRRPTCSPSRRISPAAALPPGLMPLLAFPGGYGGLVHSDGGRTSLSCCIRRDVLARRSRPPWRQGGARRCWPISWPPPAACVRRWPAPMLEGDFLSTGPIHPGIRAAPPGRHLLHRQYRGRGPSGDRRRHQHGDPVQSALLARLLIAHRGEDYARTWRRRFAPRIRAASLFAHLAMNWRHPRHGCWDFCGPRPA